MILDAYATHARYIKVERSNTWKPGSLKISTHTMSLTITGTPDQLMQLAGQITTIARAIKSKEYKP